MKSVSFYSLTGLPLLMAGSACCVNKLASRGQAASVLAASSSGSGFSGGGRLQDAAWAVAEMAHSSVHFGLPSHCKVLSISLRFFLTLSLSLLSLPISSWLCLSVVLAKEIIISYVYMHSNNLFGFRLMAQLALHVNTSINPIETGSVDRE